MLLQLSGRTKKPSSVRRTGSTLANASEEGNFDAAMAPFVEAFDYIKSIDARFDELRDLMGAET
jgi:hypothetical protein